MKNYIERYVYDVTRRLDDNLKEDVSRELLSNIYDMLPCDYTDEDVKVVLNKLGHPRVIAAKYQSRDKYLISPRVYDDYILVLKKSAIILGLLLFVTNFIQYLIASQSLPLEKILSIIISKTIVGFVEGVIYALIIVTIAFITIDRNYDKIYNKEWKLDDLPKSMELDEKPLNKANIVLGLLFGTIISGTFIYLLANYKEYIGWYTLNGRKIEIISPLYNEKVLYFIPVFIVGLCVQWIVKIFILFQDRRNIMVEVAEAFDQILSSIILIIFLYSKSIINPSFFNDVNNHVNNIKLSAELLYTIIINVIAIICFITIITLLIKTTIKVIKHKRNDMLSMKN